MSGGNKQPSIDAAEHISTADGENIEAKRVGMYVYDPTAQTWGRFTGISFGLITKPFNYFSYSSGATTDTYIYKSGGSSGTTVGTLTLTYTDSTKTVISSAEVV